MALVEWNAGTLECGEATSRETARAFIEVLDVYFDPAAVGGGHQSVVGHSPPHLRLDQGPGSVRNRAGSGGSHLAIHESSAGASADAARSRHHIGARRTPGADSGEPNRR